MEGLPWIAKIDEEGNAKPLLPPMTLFPPGKRPDGDTIEDGAEIIVWDSRNKKWLRIQGGSTKYGIVMEAISQPEDVTAEPPGGMGKIRILGKTYPTEDENGDPVEPVYDDCGCLLLAETEELLNEQVKVIGPFEYDNPESDPENEESEEEPEKKSYYLAVDIADGYDGLPLESELTHGGESTIKVQKGKDEDDQDIELEFTVHDGVLAEGQKYAAGTPVLVKRTAGKLYVVDGPCPEEIEEEPEEEEEEPE